MFNILCQSNFNIVVRLLDEVIDSCGSYCRCAQVILSTASPLILINHMLSVVLHCQAPQQNKLWVISPNYELTQTVWLHFLSCG